MKRSYKGPLILLLCSFFWGIAFASQSNAMNHVGPYTFVFLRSLVTCLVLTASLPLTARLGADHPENTSPMRAHWIVGALCGTFLVLASSLQQIGLMTTSTAKSGFITALYIVIVPIIGMFLGRRPSPGIWVGVAVSMVGLYFLCMKGSLVPEIGDLMTLASACVFAIHITLIDRFGSNLNSLKLCAIQFGTSAVIAGVLAFTLEAPTWAGVLGCWKDVAFVAVFSGAIGFSFQIIGQKYTEPTLASLIMCLESVFAAIGGWVLLGQTLTGREILGCVLMFSASIIALLPAGRRQRA